MTQLNTYFIRLCGGIHDGADIAVYNGHPPPPIIAIPNDIVMEDQRVPVDPVLWGGPCTHYTLAHVAKQNIIDLKTDTNLGLQSVFFYHKA